MTQNMINRLRKIALTKMQIPIVQWLEYLTLERLISWKALSGNSYNTTYLGTEIHFGSIGYLNIRGYVAITNNYNPSELLDAMKALETAIHFVKTQDFTRKIENEDSEYYWG